MTEPKTLSACLERAAGTDVGVHFAGRAGSDSDAYHSYADIHERALDVASGLRALGIGKAEGDRVAVAIPTSIEFYDGFFGAVLAGAVPVSLPLPRPFGPVDDYLRSTEGMLRASRARISIRECPALAEEDGYSWFAQLGNAPHPALDAICEAVNPFARCHPVDAPGEARLAWDIVIDRSREPQEETKLMNLARLSRGATFELMRRRPLRN